jgi:hypothetical protein
MDWKTNLSWKNELYLGIIFIALAATIFHDSVIGGGFSLLGIVLIIFGAIGAFKARKKV